MLLTIWGLSLSMRPATWMGSTSFLLTVGYLVTCKWGGGSVKIIDNKGAISDTVRIGYCYYRLVTKMYIVIRYSTLPNLDSILLLIRT